MKYSILAGVALALAVSTASAGPFDNEKRARRNPNPTASTQTTQVQAAEGIFYTRNYQAWKPYAEELGLKKPVRQTNLACDKTGNPAGAPEAQCRDYVGKDGQTYRLVILRENAAPVLIARLAAGVPVPFAALHGNVVVAAGTAPTPPIAGAQPDQSDPLGALIGTIIKKGLKP